MCIVCHQKQGHSQKETCSGHTELNRFWSISLERLLCLVAWMLYAGHTLLRTEHQLNRPQTPQRRTIFHHSLQVKPKLSGRYQGCVLLHANCKGLLPHCVVPLHTSPVHESKECTSTHWWLVCSKTGSRDILKDHALVCTVALIK